HVAALHRQLLGQVGDGDRLADRDLAHDRRGRAGEAGAGTGLLGVAARLRLAAAAGAAARAIGRAQVHLAGEARGALVVLGPGDHRVRAAGLVARALVLGARGRLRVAVAMGLAPDLFRRGQRRCLGGSALGLEPGGLFLAALALGFLGAALVGLGQALLLGQVALARFLQLAQDLGALAVLGGHLFARRLGRLDQGHLLAHHHVHRAAVLAAAHGQLLLAAAAERDLARRGDFLGALAGLAVGALEEAEQLDLLHAGDDLVGTVEVHAGLGQLLQQFVDRRVHQFGQLADGGLLRHSVSVSSAGPPGAGGSGPAILTSAQPSRSRRAISSAWAARISAAARSSSRPSMPSSATSSAPSSPRSSAVRTPWPASANAVSSSMPSSCSRSSAGWFSSRPSSTANASLSRASRARARSSSTMSSSKPSTASSSPTGT